MKVKLKDHLKPSDPRVGYLANVNFDKEYECEFRHSEFGRQIMLDGQDVWLPIDSFNVIEEAPKLYRSSNETPDEILEWYGNRCSDSPVEMSKEIHMLRGALHDLKNEINGKMGSATAIVDLGRVYVDQIETLMKAFNKGED